jgi:hypothetical protein
MLVYAPARVPFIMLLQIHHNSSLHQPLLLTESPALLLHPTCSAPRISHLAAESLSHSYSQAVEAYWSLLLSVVDSGVIAIHPAIPMLEHEKLDRGRGEESLWCLRTLWMTCVYDHEVGGPEGKVPGR